jgi:hypothetical protein
MRIRPREVVENGPSPIEKKQLTCLYWKSRRGMKKFHCCVIRGKRIKNLCRSSLPFETSSSIVTVRIMVIWKFCMFVTWPGFDLEFFFNLTVVWSTFCYWLFHERNLALVLVRVPHVDNIWWVIFYWKVVLTFGTGRTDGAAGHVAIDTGKYISSIIYCELVLQ